MFALQGCECLGLIHRSNERSRPEKRPHSPYDNACGDKQASRGSFLSIQQGLFGSGGTVGTPRWTARLTLKYKKCKVLCWLSALPGPHCSLSAGPLRGPGYSKVLPLGYFWAATERVKRAPCLCIVFRSAGDRGECLLFWSVREQLAFCLSPLSLFNKETENIFKVFLFDLRSGTLL